MMKFIICPNLNLSASIESGQIFRYEKRGTTYYISIRNTLLVLKQENNKLYYDGTRLDGKQVPESLVRYFLRLDEDYDKILLTLQTDKYMISILKKLQGLRILRQDPWECMISFLASLASNIPKHTLCLQKLAQQSGILLQYKDYKTYTFPSPGKLPNEHQLRDLGFGFRAKYIHAANVFIKDNSLNSITNVSYQKAKAQLMTMPGISDKVSNCICLYSLNHLEAFPVDVWIKRTMEHLFFKNKKTTPKTIEEFGQKYYGQYAGYAQQFLFHSARRS